ncbi:MAG: PorV/PorQ family protein [Elusimicrobia bacterium]|nr:PorV/PorQ family protein [Elusimicrobiota bacterium]
MRRLGALVLALLACTTAARAVSFSEKAKGTSSAQVLRLAQGARAIGMGEAYAALADDPFALYWNPAGLNHIQRPHAAGFMHAFYVADINFGYAAWISRLPGAFGRLGAAYQYLNIGKIDQTDDGGLALGSYSPKDTVVTVGWAGAPFSLPIGIAAKHVSSKIVASASTYAFDVGVNSPVRFLRDRLAFSAVAKNIGSGLKFHTESDPLPLELRLGSAFTLYDTMAETSLDVSRERAVVTVDVVAVRDNKHAVAVGIEHAKIMGSPMTGRAGFNSRSFDDISGMAGLFMGFGVEVKSVNIDYALAPMGHLGLTHRISMGYSF